MYLKKPTMTDSTPKKNVPNGGKGRPPGTKNHRPHKRSFAVDAFRSTQSPEWVTEFDHWVGSFRPTITDIHNRLKEAGYEKGWSSVQTWYAHKFPTGEQAKLINDIASKMHGISPHAMLEMSLYEAADALRQVVERVNEAKLDSVAPIDAARMVGPLVKEVRATASKIQDFQGVETAKELQLAGGVAVVEHLLATFENNPTLLEPLREACRSAIAKLQGD